MSGTLAVTLHDVQPSTFERCVQIRDWLGDRGVERVTLLVIPAPRLHPFVARTPELAYWLLDRRDAGDAVAQHGLQHARTRPQALFRRWQGADAIEFPGLDDDATVAGVETGRRILAEAGVPPRGFVAPAFAYTAALRAHLSEHFDWWATLFAVHGRERTRSPALCLGNSTAFKRATSPAVVRAGAATAGQLLRLELHPGDFDHPRHLLAVEHVLRRARGRAAVTYDDLS